MLTPDEIAARREALPGSPDLQALLATVEQRIEPLLAGAVDLPPMKALLSTEGGRCRRDGTPLPFDPWAGPGYRCPSCGAAADDERQQRHRARFQHLWLAERIADLASVAVLAERNDAAERACQLLRAYGESYLDYPNRDNVLGPARLFFSTYLESVWLCSYLAAASLLREDGRLDEETAAAVSALADEAANLIGDFNEGLSNRQTWHNAARLAAAVWFEDEELATEALEGPSGLLLHLLEGFGPDGLWYEGENYHLFALRGLLMGMSWARNAGIELAADDAPASRLAAALRAPAVTALPDFTFPARKDSRFGVSLAQPMYLESWEVGLGALRRAERPDEELEGWLAALYQVAPPPAEQFESYLHEAGRSAPSAPRRRSDLSWWALLQMAPHFDGDPSAWQPGNAFLEGQGLAVLRSGDRYAALECGGTGGGHGHPDRLNLLLHAGGVYWLPDFGTGSYVTRDLFWYRSTLAHNAPRLEGVSQQPDDAWCDAFDETGEWAWARGRFGELSRALVAGPDYLIDLLELTGGTDHRLELPLHLPGGAQLRTAGSWVPAEPLGEFTGPVERFEPASEGPLVIVAQQDGRTVQVHVDLPGTLLRTTGPGAPVGLQAGPPSPFFVLRAEGHSLRLVTALDLSARIRSFGVSGDVFTVEMAEGSETHQLGREGWDVATEAGTVQLRGARAQPQRFEPLVTAVKPLEVVGRALWVGSPPALDGSLDGFDASMPMMLDHEDQYRRSEEPYAGPDQFSAMAFANWNGDGFYLAVDVTRGEPIFRRADAEPLRLDNEPEDINSDGLQIYLRAAGGSSLGYLVVPEEGGGIRTRPVEGTAAAADQIHGAWQPTESGYRVTVAITVPDLLPRGGEGELGFDLIVNQIEPDRQRRSGQLVWSGGGGWVWLRGDRQDPDRFGRLELR